MKEFGVISAETTQALSVISLNPTRIQRATGQWDANGFVVGDFVRLTGFTVNEGTNNGTVKIRSILTTSTTDDTIEVENDIGNEPYMVLETGSSDERAMASPMLDLLNQEVTTLSTLWQITRIDGVVVRVADHDRDIVFGGNTYKRSAGFSRSAVEAKSDMSPDQMQIDGILVSEDILEADIRAGRYDGAAVLMFLVDHTAPDATGKLAMRRGTFGEFTLMNNGMFQVELRGLTQYLGRNIGEVLSPTCRADVFDSASANRCKLNSAGTDPVTGKPYTETTFVEAVTSRQRFTVPALGSAQEIPATSTAELKNAMMSAAGVATMQVNVLDGTELRPFEISTPAGLDGIRNNPAAYYVLTADLDMSAFGFWTPIPNFQGSLDGRGYEIQNLRCDRVIEGQAAGPSALFENTLLGATIRRLGIRDGAFRANSGTFYKAPFVAEVSGALIEDCYAISNTITTDTTNCGGFIGNCDSAEGTTTVNRCYAANDTVIGTVGTRVGGFTGNQEGSGSAGALSNCYFDSDTWGSTSTGIFGGDTTALTTPQMQSRTTLAFGAIAFADTWKLPKMLHGAPTVTFLDAGPDTITRNRGSWLLDNFENGQSIRISGTVSNNGTQTITAISATVITVAGALTNESNVVGAIIERASYALILDPGRV